jgi:hypothetical protein
VMPMRSSISTCQGPRVLKVTFFEGGASEDLVELRPNEEELLLVGEGNLKSRACGLRSAGDGTKVFPLLVL